MCGRYCITSAPEAIRAAVSLSGAAQFPAALQCRADPAGADRADGRGRAPLRAGALGPDPVLGQGPEGLHAPDQCARRVGQRQAGVPQRHEAAALPVSGRRLLRVEARRRRQAALFRAGSSAGGPLAFAGLWETWTGPNGEEMETAAIVTTAANRTMAAVHDRAPVIVPPEAFDFWLDAINVDAKTAAAADRARARGLDGGLRDFARGQPCRQRLARADRAIQRRRGCHCGQASAGAASKPKSAGRKRSKNDGQASLF